MRQPKLESEIVPATLPFSFRRMTAGDVGRVMAIQREGFSHPWSADLLQRELAHAWSTVLLASERGRDGGSTDGQEAGEIVGFIVYWVVHDELHILNLATAVAKRRRGVGRALMLEASRRARAAGVVLSTLEVRRSNAPALALYQQLGYRQVGVRPNYYVDEGEDAIVMVQNF